MLVWLGNLINVSDTQHMEPTDRQVTISWATVYQNYKMRPSGNNIG